MAKAIDIQIASCRGGDPAGPQGSRSGVRRDASRLPWPVATQPPPGETWPDLTRAAYWRLRNFLDARGQPASVRARHCAALQATRVVFLTVAFELDSSEIADYLKLGERTVERIRDRLRHAYDCSAST